MMIPINFEKIACRHKRNSRKSIVKAVQEKDESYMHVQMRYVLSKSELSWRRKVVIYILPYTESLEIKA